MCGIAGKIARDSQTVSADLVEAMVATLHHRGPDDRGVYRAPDGRAAVGMSRLSIIDLAGGHQPIGNEDGTVQVVLNGEIYNFRELRDQLAARHRFATHTDTEVIVHLYEELGPGLLERLRGMFALAVWDQPNRRLLLARDRMGQKPLYVARDPAAGTLAFGSEIKALLADPAVSRRLDPIALDEYLTYGFVPTPRSIYAAIEKLPAGHLGLFDSAGWRVEPYWTLDRSAAAPMSEADALERFDEVLSESVRLRLISDVPLGCFLSGGLDSGVVAAVMSRLTSQPVRTFSIGFPEKDFDELADARRTADLCGTDHTERVVDWDIQAMVELLARHFDEPFADSSAVPTYHVSRMAREQITVALSGDGGDELLGGYNRYQAHRLAAWYHRMPRLLRPQWLEGLVLRLPTPSTYFGASAIKSGQYFLEFARGLRRRGWQSWLLYFDESVRGQLYTPAARDRLADARAGGGAEIGQIEQLAAESARIADPVARAMWLDAKTYLPDDILVKVDRMSMAVSLECRAPLLDHKLVEFLATVPTGLKLRRLTRKYLLRRLADRYFPKGTFDRPKQGFMMPLAVWLTGELGLWAERRLADNPAFAATCSMEFVAGLFDAHRTGRGDHSYRIWSLLMLGEFLRSTQR